MNPAMVAAGIRLLIVFLGGILVSRGLLPQEALDQLSDIGVLTQVVGFLMAAGAAGYGVWNQRKAALVAKAAALPDVREIKTTPKLAVAVESDKVQAH